MSEKHEAPSYRAEPKPKRRSKAIVSFACALLLCSLVHRCYSLFDFNRNEKDGELEWVRCGTVANYTVECATLEVPVDQFNSSNLVGETFSLALTRIKGENATKSLLLNPGGPGGSGGEYIFRRGEQLKTIVGEGFHLLSFDPRGVNQSTPLADCFVSDQQRQAMTSTWDEDVFTATGAIYARAQNLGYACKGVMGEIGAYINTPNTAADMNSILDAIGQAEMYYWGFSYGTTLGQTYAQLFPDRVGRLIIDGVSDQAEWYDDHKYAMGVIELADTDATFDEFLKTCIEAGKNCPLSDGFDDSTQLKAKVFEMVEELRTDPVPIFINSTVWGEVKWSDIMFNAIFFSMYKPTVWPQLASALAPALKGNFTAAFLSYSVTPPYNFAGEVNRFVEFNDATPVKVPQSHKSKEFILNKFIPIYNASVIAGGSLGTGYFERQFWQYPNQAHFRPASEVTTAHPLLILSTTLDPICPLQAAKGAEATFKDSVLVQQHSAGHCSVSMPSKCTAKFVRGYLYDGKMPAKGSTCEIDAPYFPGDHESLWAQESDEDKALLQALSGLAEHDFSARR